MLRKTKIICTIGPSSESPEILAELMQRGMNVARLNFSHGSHEEHQRRITAIRETAAALNKNIGIMLDTKGPEIRTGLLDGGKAVLISGQSFILRTRPGIGSAEGVQISYSNLPEEVEIGQSILLSDGLIALSIEKVDAGEITCRVVNGGVLGENKGVNVPGVRLLLPFLSEKDVADIEFGIRAGVDFIAASFTRSAADLIDIRRMLEAEDADIELIAKIESQSGVDCLDEIIGMSDGIMVARGDLGVEIPMEEVPLVQRTLVEKCNRAGKVVIIATQMLESMINYPRPTRAEVSDVANAIFDGADAIMLSGETAAGDYPVQAVEVMARVAQRAEEGLPYREILLFREEWQSSFLLTDAISYATCSIAARLGIYRIITITHSGKTSRMIARYRPEADIIAATPDVNTMRKLTLCWGVHPLLVPEWPLDNSDRLMDVALQQSERQGYVTPGDMVVVTGGSVSGNSGATDMLKVLRASPVLAEGVGIGQHNVSGTARILIHDEDLQRIQDGDIVVVMNAWFGLAPYLERLGGIIAESGGLTSDAAIMALSAGLPALIGVTRAIELLEDGMRINLDPEAGKVFAD